MKMRLSLVCFLLVTASFCTRAAELPLQVVHAFKRNAVHPQLLATNSAGTIYGISSTHPAFFKVVAGQIQTVCTLPEDGFYRDLVSAADGNFYTSFTPNYSYETNVLYRITPAGDLTQVLETSIWNFSHGRSIAVGNDGNFYFADTYYSTNGYYLTGIFKMAANGDTSILIDHVSNLADFIAGTDGNLYGTTSSARFYPVGDSPTYGTVFKLTPGGELTTLATFTQTNAVDPNDIVQAADGTLYGTAGEMTTYQFGSYTTSGTVLFNVSTNGTFKTYPCPSTILGAEPRSLVTAAAGTGVYFTSHTSNYFSSVLYRMAVDGDFNQIAELNTPVSSVITSSNGVYAALSQAGASHAGRIAAINEAGSTKILASFRYVDTEAPTKLIGSADGNVYGLTSLGGQHGTGALFRQGTNGSFAVVSALPLSGYLYGNPSFFEAKDRKLYGILGSRFFATTSSGTIRQFGSPAPYRSLVQAENGRFYATAPIGFGKIYEVKTNGTLTTIFSFNGTNGQNPISIIDGGDNTFYGITSSSVGTNWWDSKPTAFKFQNGKLSVLHKFNSEEGYSPENLLKARDGNLYGTIADPIVLPPPTNPPPSGAIFGMSPTGTIVRLAQFYATNGTPNRLIEGSDGNLYGTTVASSEYPTNSSVVFRITLQGKLTILHRFTDSEGRGPTSLAQHIDGALYGTLHDKGPKGGGSIFRINGLFPRAGSTSPVIDVDTVVGSF